MPVRASASVNVNNTNTNNVRCSVRHPIGLLASIAESQMRGAVGDRRQEHGMKGKQQ